MTSTDEVPTNAPRVFISYAHDSDPHKKAVMAFGELLRANGIDAHLDEWYVHDRRDWSEWAPEQLESAEFVLAIASPKFRERADGRAKGPDGRGSQYEGALMRNKMTEDRITWLRKILPIVLPGRDVSEIPEFLLPYSATHYVIAELTSEGILELRRVLFGQPRYPLPPLGAPAPFPADDRVPPPYRAPAAGNQVRVKKSRAKNIVGGDFHSHGD
jgi:hypothetical protein